MWTQSMKKYRIIKAILLVILIVTASLAESEQYYEVLSSFHSQYFFYNSFLCIDENERKSVIEELYQCAKEEDVLVFVVSHMRKNNDYDLDINKVIIFGDEEIRDIIQSKCGIREKNYFIPKHGMIGVSFLPFGNITQHQYAASNVISYVGKEEAVERLYQRVGIKHGFTAPGILKKYGKKTSSVIWMMVPFLLLAVTILEIAGIRKSIALKLWNGENGLSITKRFILLELVTDFVGLILLRSSIFLVYTGKIITFPMLFSCGIAVLLSCFSYLYFAYFDWNKVLDNRRKEKKLVPLILLLILVPYSIFQFCIDISLVGRFQSLLPLAGGRDEWGRWRYDNVEKYKIAAASSFKDERIYAYVQCLSIPENIELRILADRYGRYICEVFYEDDTEGQYNRYFLKMDANGNFLILDMGNIGDNEISSVKTIQKYQKEINGAIDLINERWGFEMVHYPEKSETEEDE